MRAEIAPAALGKELAHLFILDKNDRSARFHLAGTWLGAAFGREPTDTDFAALFDRDERTLIEQLAKAVADEHVVALVDLRGHAGAGRSIDMEMIILPLADAPARLLGAIHPYCTPIWLGTDAVAPPSLTSLRILDPDKELFALGNRPSVPLPAGSRATTSGRRSNLRVVEGNPALVEEPKGSSGTLPHGLRVIDGGRDPASA